MLAGLNAAAAHDRASQSRLIWCRWEPSDWASLGVVGSGVMGSDEQAAGAESQTMKAPDNDPAQFDTVFTPGYHDGARGAQTLGAFHGGGCSRGATLMRVRAREPPAAKSLSAAWRQKPRRGTCRSQGLGVRVCSV